MGLSCWTRMPAMPTRLASRMILVSLCGTKYVIAVATESAALTLLNASIYGCFHFLVVLLRVCLRSGSVMVAKFWMERVLYWASREISGVLLDCEVQWHLEVLSFFSRAGARPVAKNVYPKNSILILLNSHFFKLTVNPDLCRLLNVLASAMSCSIWFLSTQQYHH